MTPGTLIRFATIKFRHVAERIDNILCSEYGAKLDRCDLLQGHDAAVKCADLLTKAECGADNQQTELARLTNLLRVATTILTDLRATMPPDFTEMTHHLEMASRYDIHITVGAARSLASFCDHDLTPPPVPMEDDIPF